MNIKHLPLYLLCLLMGTEAFSQLTESEEELVAPTYSNTFDRNYLVDFNLMGLGSTQERLPFWLYHNQRGRVSSDSNISAWISGKAIRFFTPESFIILGAGVLYQNGTSKGIVAEELYVHFQNSWMYATAGRKHRPELYNGLSASNQSIFWSLNARPLPGVQIGTTKPLFLFSDEGFGVEGAWNEYLMGNDRYVEGARLHHKNLRFVYRKGGWEVKAGLQHMVQWAGTSPRHGELPGTFEDYRRVIVGREGGASATEGDQLNALGNALGGYEFYLSKEFRDFNIELLYNHLFEDGSGRRLGNTPDGRYGIYYENKEKDKFVHSVMYELYYTVHQSYTTTGAHKYDRYFSHSTYRSGWTYENRVIGVPFFTASPDGDGFINNKFRAHHLGIGGRFFKPFYNFPYKLLLSYAHNGGTYAARFDPKQDVFYGLYDMKLIQGAVEVNLQLGLEFNSYTAPVYGAGVHLKYRL